MREIIPSDIGDENPTKAELKFDRSGYEERAAERRQRLERIAGFIFAPPETPDKYADSKLSDETKQFLNEKYETFLKSKELVAEASDQELSEVASKQFDLRTSIFVDSMHNPKILRDQLSFLYDPDVWNEHRERNDFKEILENAWDARTNTRNELGKAEIVGDKNQFVLREKEKKLLVVESELEKILNTDSIGEYESGKDGAVAARAWSGRKYDFVQTLERVKPLVAEHVFLNRDSAAVDGQAEAADTVSLLAGVLAAQGELCSQELARLEAYKERMLEKPTVRIGDMKGFLRLTDEVHKYAERVQDRTNRLRLLIEVISSTPEDKRSEAVNSFFRHDAFDGLWQGTSESVDLFSDSLITEDESDPTAPPLLPTEPNVKINPDRKPTTVAEEAYAELNAADFDAEMKTMMEQIKKSIDNLT